jgi:hypothetical protein
VQSINPSCLDFFSINGKNTATFKYDNILYFTGYDIFICVNIIHH